MQTNIKLTNWKYTVHRINDAEMNFICTIMMEKVLKHWETKITL